MLIFEHPSPVAAILRRHRSPRPRCGTSRPTCCAASATVAGSLGNADGAPLHAPVAEELLDRHPVLSLGSCTMKYNPRACNSLAMLPQFLGRHPAAPASTGQGFLACMYELQEMLKEVTGMKGVSLTPMAGAQGEFAGVAMIRAYHDARGDTARTEILVPDAAHAPTRRPR